MLRTLLSLVAGVTLLALPDALTAQQDAALIGKGAQLYAQTCSRCHNPRGATERTDAEWGLIVLHMRARAVMSRSQAEAVLAFLQATNLPEGVAARQADATSSSGTDVSSTDSAVQPDSVFGSPTLTRPQQPALWRYIRVHIAR